MRYPSSFTSFSAMVVLLLFGIVLGDDTSSSSSNSMGSSSISSSSSSSSNGSGGSGGGGDDAGCTKFSINGSTTTPTIARYFFTRHRFYDFRRIDNRFIIGPPDEKKTLSSNSTVVSRSVNDSSWTVDWNISVKQVSDYSTDSTVSLQFSADNVYIQNSTDDSSDYSTYLVLSTTRLASSQEAGEMVYDPSSVQYASIRLLARVRGNAGAVAGIFTYYNDTVESDIEILTQDPTSSVEYSNQPTLDAGGEVIPGSNFNTSMVAMAGDDGKKSSSSTTQQQQQQWTDWNVYRLDWLPGRSAWYVNGEMAASTRVNVPAADESMMVVVNMWSDGGAWSGNMSVGDEAELQIQWIEMVFNMPDADDTSSPRGKEVVCSVDEVVGTPVRAEGVPNGGAWGFSMLILSTLCAAWLAFL